jgi:CTP:molybdopterin cytidylyltransferase MocA
MTVAGVLLAAGAGRRMGTPKALLRDASGVPFLDRAVGMLLDGGCATVTVVLGAAADDARALLVEAGWTDDEAVDVVVADAWDTGMGASLRTSLEALPTGADVAVVTLVDLPDVSSDVVGRLLSGPVGAATLARASYDGRPGHPVVIGRDHWAGVAEAARGDKGARDYLAAHEVTPVECGDLASGDDVDHPSDLGRGPGSPHDT